MAGTINYDFDPQQSVYVIEQCSDVLYVHPATVVRVRAQVLTSGNTLVYDIRLQGETGTREFDASDVFVDKATAMTEYETRIS